MQEIVLYAPHSNNRLRYVADWVFVRRLGLSCRIVEDLDEAIPGSVVYGAVKPGCYCIPCSGLLSEGGLRPHVPGVAEWGGVPLFYPAAADGYSVPGDLFASIFYLLSRYEEHLPYTPDRHGRFPPEHSALSRLNLLRRPVVDEWVELLRHGLNGVCGLSIAFPAYTFLPSYDIDIAFHTLHKGVLRLGGALASAAIKGNYAEIWLRLKVLAGKERDPYDAFGFLKHLHTGRAVRPKYFMLSALRTGAYDKNIHPMHPKMAALTRSIAQYADVGLHPSYHHELDEALIREKKVLEQVLGSDIAESRQHYIRFNIQDTPRHLLASGIVDDYSMGYGSKLGFRAGTGSPFPWYDFSLEASTELVLHPFCFMDTTAFYEEKLGVAEAFAILRAMQSALQRTGGRLVTIFHNSSLGTAPEWQGWAEAYKGFLEEAQ